MVSNQPAAAPAMFGSPTPAAKFHHSTLTSLGKGEQWMAVDVNLRRGEQGFGFRIVGGPEEGTQVPIISISLPASLGLL